MNPLDQYPAIRKALYIVQWLVNGILVVAGAVFVALGTGTEDLPTWYVLALAVGPVLWTYLGLTAQTNVTGRKRETYFSRAGLEYYVDDHTPVKKDERGAIDLSDVLTLALIVLVVVAILVLTGVIRG